MNVDKLQGNQREQNILYKYKPLFPIMPSSDPLLFDKDFKDIVSISEEAKDLFAEEKILINLNEDPNEIREMLRQLREAADAENPYMDRIRCLKIAMSIMNGDNVPNKDKQFLMENEPQMYSNAILFRRKNEKAKDLDSVLEEDTDDTAIDESSPTSVEAPTSSSVDSTSVEISIETEG